MERNKTELNKTGINKMELKKTGNNVNENCVTYDILLCNP